MAASVVEICNLALGKVGARAIESLSEDSEEARVCAEFYAPVRDLMLRETEWNFASARAMLAPLTGAPAFEWTYAFPLPADCLKVRGLFNASSEWVVEGRNILSNDNPLYLLYSARIEDPTQFDPLFVYLLATRLGMDIAYRLAPADSLIASLQGQYQRALDAARAANLNEAQTTSASSTWSSVRA